LPNYLKTPGAAFQDLFDEVHSNGLELSFQAPAQSPVELDVTIVDLPSGEKTARKEGL
jgi:hypothetical protein